MKIAERKHGFGNITEQELKNIQAGLLDLILEFDAICKKHNITYYLDGGSVLGAMRHGGFIPWDDDIDILIKRSEFDKLIAVIDQELSKRTNRFFAYTGRSVNFHRPFARYIKADTPHITPNAIAESNYPPGIFLDVFILDPAPSNKLSNHTRKLEESEEWFHKRLNGAVERMPYWKYRSINLIEKVVGENAIYSYFNKQLSAYTDEQADYYVPRNGFNYAVYDADVFQEPVYVEFEGHMLPAPTMPEKFVRTHYSIDWFLLPPPEKRLSHHLTLTSSDFGIQDFMNYYDWLPCAPQIHKTQEKRHNYQILRKKPLEKTKLYTATLKGIVASIELGTYLANVKVSTLRKAENSKDYDAIVSQLQPYIDAQLDSDLRAYGIQVDIPQDILVILLNALVAVGRFYDAARIISVYNESDSWLDAARIAIEDATQVEIDDQDNPKTRKPLIKNVPATVSESDLPVPDTSMLDVQLSLLDEITKLCKQHKIDYTLTGNALVDAIRYGKTSGTYSDISIAMTPTNLQKFIALAPTLPDDRIIEHVSTNPYYPDATARYINTQTTSYQMTAPWYKHPGAFVLIRPLRQPLRKKQLKQRQRLRKAIRLSYMAPKYIQWMFAPLLAAHKKALLPVVDSDLDYVKTTVLTKVKKTVVRLEGEELTSYTTIQLNNKNYQVLEHLVHKISTEKPWVYLLELKDPRKEVNRIRSASVPYEQLLQRVPKGLRTKYYIAKIHEYLLLQKIKQVEKSPFAHKKILSKVAYNFYKFKLQKEYGPLTDRLLELAAQKDYVQLESMLNNYLENFNYFFQQNKILAFNPTVLAVHLELLRHQGKAELADYISHNIKPKDFVPIAKTYDESDQQSHDEGEES